MHTLTHISLICTYLTNMKYISGRIAVSLNNVTKSCRSIWPRFVSSLPNSNSMIFCFSRPMQTWLLSFFMRAIVSHSSSIPFLSASASSNTSRSHFSRILCLLSMASGAISTKVNIYTLVIILTCVCSDAVGWHENGSLFFYITEH